MPSELSQQTGHMNIAQLLKQFREEAGKTQRQLAQDLTEHDSLREHNRTISQWVINRIENGNASLRPIVASALDSYAVDNGLSPPGFSLLVRNLSSRKTTRKDSNKIDRFLQEQNYSSLFVVICDVFDFAGSLQTALSIPELQLSVIVPTMNRIRELFTCFSPDGKRTELFDGYVDHLRLHIDEQIQLIHDVCGRSREARFEILESGVVLNSIILAKGDLATRCMYWPCTPGRPTQLQPNFAPVVDDAAVSAWYETQIINMMRLESVTRRVFVGDMLVASDEESSLDGTTHVAIGESTFSRLCPRKIGGADTDKSTEGAAVALILPYVSIVRGGRQLTQVLFDWRSPLVADEVLSSEGQLSFIATRVFSPLVWQAIDDMDYENTEYTDTVSSDDRALGESSTYLKYRIRDLDHQSRRILARMDSYSEVKSESLHNSEHLMIDRSYASAVYSHLSSTYGIDCGGNYASDNRVESIDLMDCRVTKAYGANIAPRLHLVRLHAGERDTMIQNAARYTAQEIACFSTGEVLEMIERHRGVNEPGRYGDCLGLVIGHARYRDKFRELVRSLADCETL